VLLVHPLALPEADLCRAARPHLRIAAAYLAPSNLPTVHDPLLMGPLRIAPWVPLAARRWLWRRIGTHLIDPVALPALNGARAAHGLAPVRSLLDYLFAVPDLSIALFPAWFAATQPDWPRPLLRAGFPLYDPDPGAAPDPALARFLAAGAAPIVFTPGTGNRQATRYFEAALDATIKLGRRAILLTPHAQQLPADLPAAVLWQAYVPLRALLPQVAALVHHGGIGTTAEALRAGTPQLVVPLAHDQFDNAARVAALGAGGVLPATRLSAARLQRSLRRLLASPTTPGRCRALAAQFSDGAHFDSLPAVLATLAVAPR
jgi:rhamnosyltransferase subunit B